jgi:thiol-disulfide isomerase/thioredoxin
MKKKLFLFVLGFISCLVILAIVFITFVQGNITMNIGTETEQPVSDTVLPESEVVPITVVDFLKLKDTFSRTTIVNFWTSWYIPSKEEIPLLIHFCEQNGYQLIFVSADRNTPKQSKKLKKVMQYLNLPFSYILKESSSIDLTNEEALKAFLKNIGIKDYPGGFPYMVVYQPKGQIVSSFSGFDENRAFESFMDKVESNSY